MGKETLKKEVLLYYNQVLNYITKISGDRPLSEDVLQDSYLALLTGPEVDVDPRKVKSWFTTVAYNMFLSKRTRGYGKFSRSMVPMCDEHLLIPNHSVEEDYSDKLEKTLKIISGMKPDYQEVFRLRMEGASYKTMTERTGLNQAQLTALLYRGRIKIRAKINK